MSCALLIDAVSKVSRAVKKEQEALDQQVLAHYATLTEAEIKTLVVQDKWLASIQSAIEGEIQRVIQALTERVKELEERYAQPLPDLAQEVEAFSAKSRSTSAEDGGELGMSTHRPHIPNWKTVKLGEVTEIIKGGTPSRNVEKYFRGNIAWAIPSDITALDSFLFIDDTETHIYRRSIK